MPILQELNPRTGDNGMSLFIAGTIAGASLVAGLLIAMSEQIRAGSYRRRVAASEQQHATQMVRIAGPHCKTETTKSASATREAVGASAELRAAAYREILDALDDDLDQDIAEWEAILQDFPQVIAVAEPRAEDDRPTEPAVETEIPSSDSITPLHRTRRGNARPAWQRAAWRLRRSRARPSRRSPARA